jgi:Tfp pilus assembly protein PilP
MKKIAILIMVLLVVGCSVNLFADGEKSVFQMIADTMKPGQVKEKNKLIPLNKAEVVSTKTFQHMSDGIKEGSEKAKASSLREEKTK